MEQPVQVPPQIYLSWYGGVVADPALADGALGGVSLQRLPPALRAGDRWRLTARLKAPHGASNPHGFDLELWMWEQGLQASGYVRAGPSDVPPQRLGTTWQHPFERARQAVRDAIWRAWARSDGEGARRGCGPPVWSRRWSRATRPPSSAATGTCSAPPAWRT